VGAQLVPSHLAMYFAPPPPAVRKLPPAISSPLKTVRAFAEPLNPLPTGAQLVPFHLAMCFALAPSAVEK
jgi:hypothetical protein